MDSGLGRMIAEDGRQGDTLFHPLHWSGPRGEGLSGGL
jgi:hypothetical protein